jgi:hypothetical protein
MSRYSVAIADAANPRRRYRYRRWGVWDNKRYRWVADYSGEFARRRAESHASELNAGGVATGFARLFMGGR